MDRRGERLRVSVGLVCLVIFVIGNVQAAGDVCRTGGCKAAGAQTFKYAVGTTYQYSYDGKIEVSLSSAEGQATSTEVKADVLLTQLADCNQVLRLRNVQVIGSSGKKFGTIPDIEKPIRINNNDGVIDDSICVVDGDNQNSINVKRAIASIFQASLTTGYETDVFGTCPTDSSSHKEGNVLVVTKARNLNKCSYREHIQQDFLATAFNLNSEIKSSPLLNGEYTSNIRIKNGILEQAKVTEDYLYVPFSVGKNGAKAQIVSKLQFTGTSKDNAPAPVSKPRSIIFENPHPVNSPSSNTQIIFNAVKEVANTVDIVVGENTAREFINLLKIVKVSTKGDLLAVYNQVKSGMVGGDKDTAKRLFLDALLRSGNGDSIEAVLELLKQNELSDTDSKLALLGLNFVRHATKGALNAAVDILDKKNLPREAYLGIGNIAGHFCRQHSCENDATVNKLTDKLLTKVVTKPATREQENDVIYALKGLANFHQLNDGVVQKIIEIVKNAKDYSSRIRVTALETYLADPCKEKLRNNALNILKDIQQDSEVRIKAYLVLAQCPNAKIGNAIKTLLEKEPSIQVGGFITSHIRSVRASANPDKSLAKQHLAFSLKKRFPIDPRKYSFNGEFSYAVDTLGLAASSEANVIYSQNSWLPRSTSLNLTAQVFGHNFNLLEIETRQENLDRLVEHYFGPKGVLSSSNLGNAINEGRANLEKILEYTDKKLKAELQRSKRELSKNEIDQISNKIHIKTSELNKDLDLDVSLKAFGSELLFLNLNQKAEKISPEAIIDDIISQLSQGLDRLNGFQETLRENILFLDAEFDYPTSLGFPLRLAVEGSANVQVKAEGAVDIRKILNSPPEDGELKLKLIPSANVEVSGRLSLDALVVENGLKVVTTLYSSIGGDLTLSWSSKGFDLRYGLPVQEQKIISANHEIVFIAREQAGRETNLPLKFTQVKDFSICVDQLSPFIGLTFCAEINGPNLGGQQIPILPFPLSGDAKFAVTIENNDVAEYRIRHTVEGRPTTKAALILETIGKNNQRKVALELQGEIDPEHFVKAVFSSAAKSASAEGRFVSTNVEKSLLLRVTDDNNEYLGKVGIAISGTPERAVYKPILQYKTPAGEQPLPVRLEGQIVVEKNAGNLKYIFENVKLVDAQVQISLNGNVGKLDQVLFSDLTLSDGQHSYTLQGRLQLTNNLLKYNVKHENGLNRHVNFAVQGELKKEAYGYDNYVQLIHGPDLNSKTSVLTISNSFRRDFTSPSDFNFETKNSVSYPLLGISGKFELEHTPKTLDYDVEAQYGELKLGSELEAKINQKTDGDYEVEFEVWGLENKLEIKSKRQILPNDESEISNTLEVNGKKFEVKGKVRHQIHPNNLDIGGDLTVNIPSRAAPLKVSARLKLNADELDTYNKVNSGSEIIIDAFLKANKNGNANGSVKVNIKNILTVNGKVQANGGAGSGDILVDLQNGKHQIKGETTFNIQPAKSYDISVTVYPSLNTDKNKKIYYSTQTKVSDTGIDSKNRLDILDYSWEVNTKGSRTGDSNNGKVDGEIEVTLPSEQYILVKANSDYKEANDLLNGQAQASVEYRKNKNSRGRKIAYKGTWRNTNIEEGLIDVDYTLSADDSNGLNWNNDISLQLTEKDGSSSLKFNEKIYGSALEHPLEVSVVSQCKDDLTGNYVIQGTWGPLANLNVNGNHNLGGDRRSGSLNAQLSTSWKELKTLNVELQGSVNKPLSAAQPLEASGLVNIFAAGNNPDPIVDLKSQGSVQLGISSGEIKGNIALSKIDPITVTAVYDRIEDNTRNSGSVTVTYGAGKTVQVDSSLQRTSDHQYRFTAGLQTPVEGYRNSQISVQTKRSQDNKSVNSAVELSLDGKIWKGQTDLVLSDLSPSVDIKVTAPDGKVSEVFAKGNQVSSKQFSGELKLTHQPKQFVFDGAVTVNVENLDNLIIKGQVNSPSLNLNKIVFEANNKGGSTDRKIQIIVKSANKNLISGNAGYTAKEESGKFIVEGSGNFKVRDESKTGNFKYILQKLETDKNGETGAEISFDAVLGNQAIDSEFKITNKHFRFQNSYCEQKKECAYVEIDNKLNSNDIQDFNQVLEVNLDLRKLGLSHEFGLKAVTTRKEWVIDHTVDAHFQNQENSKYQYSFYIHPRESGLSLTTPKRIVALEGKYNPPRNIKEGGKSSGEIAFYMDKKNHANKKTALNWELNVDLKGTITGQSKFTHPGLKKPLSASVRAVREGTPYNGNFKIVGELDVFANDNQKIVTTYLKSVAVDDALTKGSAKVSLAIQSKGLDIDILAAEVVSGDRNSQELTYDGKINYRVGKSNYENLVSTKWSPREISGTLKVLNKELLKVVEKLQISQQEQIIESEVTLHDNNPIVSRLEVKNLNTLTWSVGYKNTPNNKLLFNAGLIPSQVADVRLDYLNAGAKSNLFYATVNLDDANFLKSDHQVNSEAIKTVLQKAKDHSTSYLSGLEALSKEWADDAKREVNNIGELAKKAAPNLQPLKNYYSKELEELKNEILNDKSIKELGEALRTVLGSLVTAVSEIFEKVSQIAEEAAVVLQESFRSVIEALEKDLIPQIKNIASKAIQDIKEILEISLDITLNLLANVSQIIEKYQPEIQQLAAAFGELTRDFGKIVQSTYQNARENLRGLIDRIVTELKASPFIDELKAQYEQLIKEGLPSADGIVNALREIFNTIRDLIPVEFAVKNDINTLLDTITNYVEKKLKNQPVDDIATIEQIGQIIATIAKKLFEIISSEGYQLPGAKVDSSSLLPYNYFKNLPRLVAVKFSPFSYLLDQNLPADLSKFLLSLVAKPCNSVPPFPLYGLIVNQGQHIFTFDGKHVTFSGSCKYLLAGDAVNGNFTLGGTYEKGLLTSITLADKPDSAITLLKGGKIKFNNNDKVELPLRRPEIAAWRSYEVITLHATAGVTVECTPDLLGCAVSISGFYHGQLRGLLGNGNAESYDDFTVPRGTIVTAEGEFVNSYKLDSACADAKVPQHEQVPENPACSKLFGWESQLSLCYPFVPTENFKAACALGLAAKAAGTEESIAKAYVAACQERGIPVHTPESLVKCANGDKPYSVGDTYTVKLPSKSADIVLIVDTEKNNTDLYQKLVQSLVPEVSRELKSKGVNDIEFHLITYGGLNQWPSHVTVNGKLTFKGGKPPALKFSEAPKDEVEVDLKQIRDPDIRFITTQLVEALHDLTLVTGLNLKTDTYNEAHNYPFRANALKSIIVVNSQPCEISRLYPLQKLLALVYRNPLISLNLFTPFSSLSLKSSSKIKDVVGFNNERVFVLSQDAAKKNVKGSAELHKELVYDDYCVDFSIKNRGNAFVNNNFLSLSEKEQKQYVSIAAANVVEQLINVEQGLDCECKLVNPYQARNVCKESYIKDRQSKKV